MKMFFNHRLSRTTLTNVRVGRARTPAALDTPILAWRLFDGTNCKRKLLIMLVCMLCVCSVNATTWYVDAANGSDANTGTSSETALATIQSAVDKASERDTVLVGSGIYVPSSTSKYGVVNSDKKITIKSQNGYASTIIDAQNQMCCLYGGGNYNHTNCVLVGFSLINGRSPSNFNMGGAAIGGTVINCVVSNCFARSNAGAGHFTRFVNCLLTRNWTTEGYASVAYSSELINCTIVGNYVSGSLAGGQCAVYNCTLRNCILWKNLSSGNSVVTTYGICTTSNCCTSDPRFKDEAIGDYRLTSDSPCVNTGDDSFVRWDTDLAGNIRNNGTVDIGAYEYYPVELSLKGITAKQRYPWNGKVDVQFKLETSDSNNCVVMLFAKDVAGNTNLPMRTVYKLDGSAVNVVGELVSPGTHRWVWDAAADLPDGFECDQVTVEVKAEEYIEHDKVQLWEGGPYWATTNIGAEKPEEYGCYFWWGDTVGYKRESGSWVATDGSSSNFVFSTNGGPTYHKDINTLKSEGWIAGDGVLAPEHDAANVQWGGNWRMPTDQEVNDLRSKCDMTSTMVNGVKGCRVCGRGDYSANSIFLPYAGRSWGSNDTNGFGSYGSYWTSVSGSDSTYSCRFYFETITGSIYFQIGDCSRGYGQPVRPVQGSENNE